MKPETNPVPPPSAQEIAETLAKDVADSFCRRFHLSTGYRSALEKLATKAITAAVAAAEQEKKQNLGEKEADVSVDSATGQKSVYRCPLCRSETLIGGPIELNDKHLDLILQYAVDDRLWTTQETVGVNLRTFAREIIRDIDWQPFPKGATLAPNPSASSSVLPAT